MSHYTIENVEWVRSVGCVLTLFNQNPEFHLFSDGIIFNIYGVEKCRGFVAVLREDADKCNEVGMIRVTIRLDTTYDIPAKNDTILLSPINLE